MQPTVAARSILHPAGDVPTRPVLITVRDVAKTYRTADGEVESLKPLTFDIADGEFLAIVGPSGCGKSTLLKMLAGLLPASQGRITLNGKDVRGPPDDVGIVFQSPVLLAWRTVLANVMLQIEMRHLSREQYLPKAKALLHMAGLGDFERKLPWQLSGGMQQRAAICRALVHDPSVLLMDEPFGALDAMTRERMNLELQRIWYETRKTVLFITHSIPEAIFLSDRVLVMGRRPSTIVEELAIDLPRPRHIGMTEDESFNRFVRTLRKAIEASHAS